MLAGIILIYCQYSRRPELALSLSKFGNPPSMRSDYIVIVYLPISLAVKMPGPTTIRRGPFNPSASGATQNSGTSSGGMNPAKYSSRGPNLL